MQVKYVYEKGLDIPEYNAYACGSIIDSDDGFSDDQNGDLSIFINPKEDEDIHFIVPLLPLLDDIVNDYGEEKAEKHLRKFYTQIASKLLELEIKKTKASLVDTKLTEIVFSKMMLNINNTIEAGLSELKRSTQKK